MRVPSYVMDNAPLDAFATSIAEASPGRDEPSVKMLRELVTWAAIEIWWSTRAVE